MESRGRPPASDDDRSARGGREFPGSDVLAGGSALEVLRRLCESDPLGMHELARRAVVEGGWFLDPNRLTLRTMARAAYAAADYAGDPPLAEWLRERSEEAIADLLDEQYAEEASETPIDASADRDFYHEMAQRLETEPLLARLLCRELNNAPLQVRRAFHALQIQGKSLHRFVAEGNGPPERVRAMLREAGERLLRALQRRFPDQFGGGG